MKFASFDGPHGRRTGVVQGDSVVDVSAIVDSLPIEAGEYERRGIEPAARGPMRWLQASPQVRADACGRIASLVDGGAQALPLASLVLQPPVARPGKIPGVGRNYADHAKETGVSPFEKPRIIFKMPSAIAAPGAPVRRPAHVEKFDFEGELAVVIGSFAKDLEEDRALDAVAGYTILNDLSAREFQFDVSPPQTTFAKSMDGFCPLGPWLVSADEVPDPQDLQLRTTVNGQPMQDATTADMLFPVRTLLAYLSRFMTLEPGDVVATGTPAGIGAFRNPPVWLRAGDVVDIAVGPLGTLRTTIA